MIPEGPAENFETTFFVQCSDDVCLTVGDLEDLATNIIDSYNLQVRLDIPYLCDPNYFQLTSLSLEFAIPVYCTGCRETELGHQDRRLAIDVVPIAGIGIALTTVLPSINGFTVDAQINQDVEDGLMSSLVAAATGNDIGRNHI